MQDSRVSDLVSLLEEPPNWLTKWGTLFISTITCLVLFLLYYIKYPDIITARVIVTSEVPPSPVISHSEGKLILFVKNGTKVLKSQTIGLIETNVKMQDVDRIHFEISNLKKKIRSNENSNTLYISSNLLLGELQPDYLSLVRLINNRDLLYKSNSNFQIKQINNQIESYNFLLKQNESQLLLHEEEIKILQKRLDIDSKLFKEKVISDLDLDATKTRLLQTQRIYESSKYSITNNKIQINLLNTQIYQIQKEKSDKINVNIYEIENAIRTLENSIEGWKEKYLLTSPFEGKIALSEYWTNNQYVKIGVEVMSIIPTKENLYARILLPVSGSGKVEVKQKVKISFDNYPVAEFGSVTGLIKSISTVPREGFYTIQVELSNGLKTIYGKNLKFKNQMEGNAEIITNDQRVIDRLFSKFRFVLGNY